MAFFIINLLKHSCDPHTANSLVEYCSPVKNTLGIITPLKVGTLSLAHQNTDLGNGLFVGGLQLNVPVYSNFKAGVVVTVSLTLSKSPGPPC